MAGIIHDIGKIAVPAEILSTPRRLTAIEFSMIPEAPKLKVKNHIFNIMH